MDLEVAISEQRQISHATMALVPASRYAVAVQRISPSLIRKHPNRLLSSSSTSEVATTGENLPSKPIDFAISAKIEGEESQIAKVKLRPGEVLRAESGAMLYMTEGIDMNTSTSLQGEDITPQLWDSFVCES